MNQKKQATPEAACSAFTKLGQLTGETIKAIEKDGAWCHVPGEILPSLKAQTPQIAEAMGVTRQGAQKQIHLLVQDGLIEARPNPGHKRSPRYVLTEAGRRVYARVEQQWQAHAEAVAAGAQTDLDELGIAKNAREEKLAARKKEHDPAYHAEMAKLYAQHVLKEQPTLQIQGLRGFKKKQDVQEVLHKPEV